MSLWGMGWRCTPRNIMDIAWMILLIPAAFCLVKASGPLVKSPAFYNWVLLCGYAAICAAVLAIMVWSQTCWQDSVVVQDGRSVVIVSDGHGSFGNRKAFLPMNDLVHGQDLEYDWSVMKAKLPSEP